MKIPFKSKYPSSNIKSYAAIIAIVWTGVLLAIFLTGSSMDRQDMLREARINANASYEKDIVYRRWNADQGGVYVQVTDKIMPNPYLDVPERDVIKKNGESLTLINPAYMTRQVHELGRESYGIRGHITSLNPIRPQNAPDPWETAALKSFQQGTREAWSEETLEGLSYLRFMRPLITEKQCLKCHAKQGYLEGDIRGGISVAVPLEPYFALHTKHVRFSMFMYVLIWITGIGGIAYGTHRISTQMEIREKVENERNKAEEALRESETINRSLLEGSPVCNKIITTDFKLQYMSSAGIKTLKISDINTCYGKEYPPKFFCEESRNAIIKKLKVALAGEISEVECITHTTEGDELWYLHTFVPVIDVDGQVKHIIGSSVNVTERKKMEQSFLQSEKLKSLGELAGGVAHDFNNVLAAILGRAQLLKMTFEPPQGEQERRKSMIELKESLDVIEQASRDGAETVRRIQEFARRRDEDKHFSTVDLNEIVNNALDFTRMKWKDNAESQGIKFTIQKEFSTLPTTSGSATELREVFTNLIHNALDAMPQGGEIRIKTYIKGGFIVITVEDTGSGIPRALRGKIFDPFFTTKGVQSTGLGMSVSYGIIQRHRGTISVDSVEGQGTTFTIELPVRVKTAEEGKVKPISGEIKKARILVIEDEAGVRNLFSAILKKGGHEVETAESGGQGIEKFEKEEFDLVFTDLGMPGMSGWQVAEKVKSINGRVPVVLITGWDIRQEESEMKNSYVDLIIHKPFEVDQVLNLVQEGMILRDRFKAT